MKKFLVLALIITSCGSGEALEEESLPTNLEVTDESSQERDPPSLSFSVFIYLYP